MCDNTIIPLQMNSVNCCCIQSLRKRRLPNERRTRQNPIDALPEHSYERVARESS
nr:MAG TPA: hypothetical protein [Caudoviricetes sp.]